MFGLVLVIVVFLDESEGEDDMIRRILDLKNVLVWPFQRHYCVNSNSSRQQCDSP